MVLTAWKKEYIRNVSVNVYNVRCISTMRMCEV